MSPSHHLTQRVGFSPEKSLVHVQHRSPLLPPPPPPSAPAPLRSCLSRRPSHTPTSLRKTSYEAPKKLIRFLRDSPPSTGPNAALQSTNADLHSGRFYRPGDSSPNKPTSIYRTPALASRSLDVLAQASPTHVAAFQSAMSNALSLLDAAMSSPSKKPAAQPTPAALSAPAPQPTIVPPSVPSPQPAPRPVVIAPSTPARAPRPTVARSPEPARLTQFSLCRLALTSEPPSKKRIARTASWLADSYSPDAHMSLASSPTWSHCPSTESTSGRTTLFSPGSNDTNDSRVSTSYRVALHDRASIPGTMAGINFWRLPRGSTRHLLDTIIPDQFPSFLSPTPQARHKSVDTWLEDIPTPLRPQTPPTSRLWEASPLGSSFFGSSTGSPAPEQPEPESPLVLRARGLPVTSTFTSTSTLPLSQTSVSDDVGPPPVSPKATLDASDKAFYRRLADWWDDGHLDRVVDSPLRPSERTRLWDSPVPSSLFESWVDSPDKSPASPSPAAPSPASPSPASPSPAAPSPPRLWDSPFPSSLFDSWVDSPEKPAAAPSPASPSPASPSPASPSPAAPSPPRLWDSPFPSSLFDSWVDSPEKPAAAPSPASPSPASPSPAAPSPPRLWDSPFPSSLFDSWVDSPEKPAAAPSPVSPSPAAPSPPRLWDSPVPSSLFESWVDSPEKSAAAPSPVAPTPAAPSPPRLWDSPVPSSLFESWVDSPVAPSPVALPPVASLPQSRSPSPSLSPARASIPGPFSSPRPVSHSPSPSPITWRPFPAITSSSSPSVSRSPLASCRSPSPTMPGSFPVFTDSPPSPLLFYRSTPAVILSSTPAQAIEHSGLSWKTVAGITAGVAAGAFALGCLAARYLF